MSLLFTHNDAWSGGYYELVIRLPDASSLTVEKVITHLWAEPSLMGYYRRSDIEPSEQQKIAVYDISHQGHLYGVATLPNGKLCCCGAFWSDFEQNGCWLTFYLPLGSLAQSYAIGGYPFGGANTPSPEQWINEINPLLVSIARSLYAQIQFKVGMIGFDIDFYDVEAWLESRIPSERWEGILVPTGAELQWYPPTIFEPQYIMGTK